MPRVSNAIVPPISNILRFAICFRNLLSRDMFLKNFIDCNALYTFAVLSTPVEEGGFGDPPNPGRGLAALCTPAQNDPSSEGGFGDPQTPAEGCQPSALPLLMITLHADLM